MLVYILFTPKGSIFYTGFTTETIEIRLQRHLEEYYDNKFTSRHKDWEVFLTIDCSSNKQGRLIECHIKRMKSNIYIRNLKKYPEMVIKLLNLYKDS